MKRTIRRTAMLHFEKASFSRDYVKWVGEEGFTDIGLGLKPEDDKMTGQGYVWEKVCRLAEWAGEFGLGVIVFTGYMKYRETFLRTHPERCLVCVGGSGAALDSDNIVRTRWLCPFQPENKAEYVDLIHKVIRLPAVREVHLNDEAEIGFSNGDVGCYCEHCVAEYERDTGEPPPREVDWASPSWWRWVQHRMEAWTAVHAFFREGIKKVRPDVVVGIQHSPKVVTFNDNPWLSGIDLSRDAEAMDVLCTDPYHHIHYSHFTYRPMRRILAEATRALGGATIGRSLFIYPQGFMPPSGSLELTRRDGFMAGAVPFALGAENISPYTFDLCQIIPGYYDGLKDASRLIPYFEKTRPYSAATLIKPSQTEIYGYPDKRWGREVLAIWPDVMNQVGLPWRWVFDRRLPDAGEALSGPVILPDTHCLTREQRSVLESHSDGGNGLLRVGRTPSGDWSGEGAHPPPSGDETGLSELKPIVSGHPLLVGIDAPIMLGSAFLEPGLEGETIAEVDGRPALVAGESGGRREVWLAGTPLFNYVEPGDHGAVRTPTGGMSLLRNALAWLSAEAPAARLWPYPPKNDYGELRPWDRRDVPTMELFPSLGDGCLVCLIFNYLGLAYETNLEMRVPEGSAATALEDIYSGEDLMGSAAVAGQIVRLPVDMPGDRDFLAVELQWE